MSGSTDNKTPLARKLGIKPGMRILLVNQPTYYENLFSDFPDLVTVDYKRDSYSIDLIHAFFHNQHELKHLLPSLRQLIKPDGQLWCSWLKQASGIKTDLNREDVRRLVLGYDLVDIKVCSVSADWSALKFLIPKALRK